MRIVEEGMYNRGEIGVVMIEGMGEMVYEMKRGGEWRGMIWKVMEWREEREIEMDRIVDEKKGDENGRGDMGRELKNKGERVLVVEKEKRKGDIRSV